MKKWMYLIAPSIMLALFLVFYTSAMKETELREKTKAEQIARAKAAATEKKRVIEEKARLDAQRRATERAAEDLKKEADRIAKWQGESKKIQDDTDKAFAESGAATKEIASLEAKLVSLKKAKEQSSRESFDLLKQVERAKVERRKAEIEIQRLTEMIVRRAADSSMTRAPVVTPVKS